jgi:hypothetical protein
MNKYKYKIVLVCPVANWFRGNDLAFVSSKLVELADPEQHPVWLKIKTPKDLEYCKTLQSVMSTLSDYELRIEHPLINVYTNIPVNLEKLSIVDPDRVKYISIPNKANPELANNTVIVKKLDYDYKIFLGKTKQNHTSFVEWSKDNKKIKLTPTAKRNLSRNTSWGGSYFYVKGEQTLTMVRMFVGDSIAKIESVIKA